jgi:putative PIN family toxin of toxin-antitoxin system
MRVVVDTNVFISAALKDMSVPAAALRVAAQGHVLLKSRATETQLFAVCARPRLAALISPTAVSWFKDVMVAAELVEISERVVECRDPTDDMFLELAWNGKADMIISGDEDLLTMTPFRQISILTPASFLNWAPR